MRKVITIVALLGSLATASTAHALNNGLARTPPMGWNSWYTFRCNVTEAGVIANAHSLVKSGLAAKGYRYVNVDGCWEAHKRSRNGALRANAKTFPSGMAALGRKIHGMGLKFGIYTSAGPTICLHPQPGSWKHYEQDFRTFARWKVDYVKVDWCSQPPKLSQQEAYKRIARAAARAGRKMIVTVSTTGTRKPWRWAHRYGHTWRIDDDANGSWAGVMSSADTDAPLWRYAGPGRWNDPDMLQVGSPWLSDVEARTHFSLWAMLAAPLLAGYDLTYPSAATIETLGNSEVIAVDQDRLGRQGRRVRSSGGTETWVKPLAGGSQAVLLLNRSDTPTRLSIRVGRISHVTKRERYSVRDLWTHTTRTVAASDVQQVGLGVHEAVMWRVGPPQP